MALSLILDSLTRSVSEGILGEHKQPKPLADASGDKLSAIGLATPLAALISGRVRYNSCSLPSFSLPSFAVIRAIRGQTR